MRAVLNAVTLLLVFGIGALLVHRLGRYPAVRRVYGSGPARQLRQPSAPSPARPQQQISVRGFDAVVSDTSSAHLLASIERRTRFSKSNFERDCLPVLRAFAEFVQFLPASECHHHAQPGGLWVHAVEVVDAALTFRAGLEVPADAGTEERKRLEHRWTYALFVAALLHDVGKPITDVKVLLFNDDPQAGRRWAPLAGTMRSFGSHWYSVGFTDASERDYKAHARIPAILLHQFVEPRVLRWLAEDGDVLAQLLRYLSGKDPDGTLGAIVKRADSDSVSRNLLQGPRTRFSTARTRPLIERLMEALRRMLAEGGSLPLNRPGAAGWVHDGRAWFVCARLADEVRGYLALHESLQGVPGKDRNDRLFDTWQEHGAVEPAPEGGAVWRVRIDCDGWSPPDALTVLCFPLDRLFADTPLYPPTMRGRVWPAVPAGGAAPSPAPALLLAPAAATASAAPAPASQSVVAPCPRVESATSSPPASISVPAEPPPTASTTEHSIAPMHTLQDADEADELLSQEDTASADTRAATASTTPELGSPLRPKDRSLRHPTVAGKGPSPGASAFMAWVAQAVGSGELKYNEDGALVHFVREGALLLSPEVFRRFMAAHEGVTNGPIAALRMTHGDRAFARLQNELAKSGWTVRNGDENLHYYRFIKADKTLSRIASFYLIGRPELFWNPVPAANDRIRPAARPKKLPVPAGVAVSPGNDATKRQTAPLDAMSPP